MKKVSDKCKKYAKNKQKRYKEQKVEGRRQLQRMVTTTKTTGRHREQCGNGEKRKGKCKTLAGRDWEGLALGLGLGLVGSGLGLFHMYMASVVSMCLNTHLFIQIWPKAAATATAAAAAGETIKQVSGEASKC